LACSILAAAAVKHKHVVIFDDYYGGASAAFKLKDMTKHRVIKTTHNIPIDIYIDLFPRVIYSNGAVVQALLDSGVYAYMDFQPLKDLRFSSESQRKMVVPCAKEDVFTNNSLTLIQKRKIMKLLTFLTESLESDINDTQTIEEFLKPHTDPDSYKLIIHSICLLPDSNPCIKAKDAIPLLKRHFTSLAKYHKGPYLINEFGTCSEIVQGFCRSAAVSGAITILGTPYKIENKELFVNGENLGTVDHVITGGSETRYLSIN
jgi:RAB protein geranylgeranyltransferase component A